MELKTFGIEIRKTNNVQNLYSDVDIVLRKLGIGTGEINSKIQCQAVAHSLQKMLKVDSYFSICTIQNCRDLCQIHIPVERMRLYQTVHCVNWNEMLPDFRQNLVAMILDDFRMVLTNQT